MGQISSTDRVDSMSYEEFCEIFLQLKNGFESVSLSLSEEDGETLKELFERLNLIASSTNMLFITY